MRRDELTELHYITAIANVPSILSNGILCHNRVASIPHTDVSMAEVQDIRQGKRVPGGDLLHNYANLYFSARNAMLYKLLARRNELAVLRVSPDVLDLPNVVISDGNAAVGFTGFAPAPVGLVIVDSDLTFAQRWTHADPYEYRRRKAACCAEVLVPRSVPAKYIEGAFVASNLALRRFRALDVDLPVSRRRHLFFLV